MAHVKSARLARDAAAMIRRRLRPEGNEIGVILGTGWNDAVEAADGDGIPFTEIPGFDELPKLEGHSRTLVRGKVGTRPVLALRGRVHLNEHPCDAALFRMVRLQTEMLLALGIKRLIVTCGAGALSRSIRVGDIVVIDGFVTCFSPPLPLYAGEFCSPEDALDPGMVKAAGRIRLEGAPDAVKRGGYAMMRGPHFEGRRYDKAFIASTGAKTVGMSVVPEAAIAALYGDVRVLALAFVTNDAVETHSHETNRSRALARAAMLSQFLTRAAGLFD